MVTMTRRSPLWLCEIMLSLGAAKTAALSISSHARTSWLRTNQHPLGNVPFLAACSLSTLSDNAPSSRKSVTRVVYEAAGATDGNLNAPVVKLFTKDGCTLCDKVKEVLVNLRTDLPHTLEQVDITDPEHEMSWNKYKYDIPVLFVNDQYWTKHRLNEEEARQALIEASQGKFVSRRGEPDAGALEQRQAERKRNNPEL
jgi:glutaredoxin